MLGRGDGTFAGSVAYDTPSGFTIGPPFALADFNGDNIPDIVTTMNASGLSLYTLIGNGAGAFAPGVTKAITATNVGANPPLVLAGELTSATDNDAILGITTKSAGTTGTATGDVAVFLGNGNDTFGSEMDTPFNSEAAAMVTGDFNNDNALDVVVGGPVTTDSGGNPASGAVFYLEGKNNGSFDAPVPIDTPLNPVSFAAGELTSAKNLDLVVANGGTPFATTPVDGSVLVYLGNGNGTFQSPKTLSALAFPQAVAIADVNNDGHPDIVVLSEFSGQSFQSRVWVFLGDGAGNFGTGIETSLDEYADGLQVGNLNGDSFPDLALASCCGFANTEVWAGNGNGTFTGPTELPVGISSSFPILADINGDNKLDLLVATGDAIETLVNVSGEGIPTPIPAGTIFPTPTATPTATGTGARTPTATATRTATPTASGTATRRDGNVDRDGTPTTPRQRRRRRRELPRRRLPRLRRPRRRGQQRRRLRHQTRRRRRQRRLDRDATATQRDGTNTRRLQRLRRPRQQRRYASLRRRATTATATSSPSATRLRRRRELRRTATRRLLRLRRPRQQLRRLAPQHRLQRHQRLRRRRRPQRRRPRELPRRQRPATSGTPTRTATPTASATATPSPTATADSDGIEHGDGDGNIDVVEICHADSDWHERYADAYRDSDRHVVARLQRRQRRHRDCDATATATSTSSRTATPTATATPGGGHISVNPKKLNLKALPMATASATIMIANTGTGPLEANVTAPKHSPPFAEIGGGSGIWIGPGDQRRSDDHVLADEEGFDQRSDRNHEHRRQSEESNQGEAQGQVEIVRAQL